MSAGAAPKRADGSDSILSQSDDPHSSETSVGCSGALTDGQIKAAIKSHRTKQRRILKEQAARAQRSAVDPTLSERDAVTAKAERLLNAHPAVLIAWKQTVGKMRGAGGKAYTVAPSGLGDVLFLLKNGRGFGSLEFKHPDVPARLSQAQIDMAHSLRIHGYITGIITSAKQAVEIVEAAVR